MKLTHITRVTQKPHDHTRCTMWPGNECWV